MLYYHQKAFLPEMAKYHKCLVEYVIGDVDKEVTKPGNYVEWHLVLCAHDEMTSQANDDIKSSWVLEGKHVLKKKGIGCGLHQSDIICSTFGWLRNQVKVWDKL
jgi:hypothetical protein